jgi:KTSC domain
MERQTLEVEFQRRTVYQYFDVPKSLHDGLMTAGSKGRFFDQKIREKFRTLKVA